MYDHILTFDKEVSQDHAREDMKVMTYTQVEFIWQAPWTVTKVVFLLNRYGNLVCQTVVQLVWTAMVVNNTAEVGLTTKYSIYSPHLPAERIVL